ncbi:MAG: 1-acyl-sn-glycerol-3-phosphate acyltransferase [Desulfobulbaceae bacterium]|nr:MAG: 1-acyl-sn-glycerol-3-phosphate acyltransferase [Desulfobulbaceae bacterium]
MSKIAKIIFFAVIIKPLVILGLGLNIRGRKNLPLKGPAVIAANHNSHLDTMVLMSLYPLSKINRVRPVAAADYFLANKLITWISLNVIGIIPLDRSGNTTREELFDECHTALDNGQILLLFPEGSRGLPEEMGRVKKGLYHLVKDRQDTRVTPVVLHGLGLALPRGEALLVPFNCDVIIDAPMETCESSDDFVANIQQRYNSLFELCITKNNEEL